jgi:predicted aspartyl protease
MTKGLQDVKLLSRFPFILLDGGMIILKANINNLPDTLNFVLDTGCSGISLDSSTAARLKLFAKISDHNIIGISQFKKASFITNQTLRLPNFAVDSLNFHINDYTFLSNANDIQIDGIIGYSFLKRFIVKINYDSLQMEVWKPGKMKYPKEGFLMYPQLDGLAMCEAGVKDNRTINQNYVFDTGAEVCLLLSENFVLDSNVLTVTKKRIEVPAEGSGGKKLMKFTTVDELQLGPYKFKKVPTYIFKDDNNVMRYPGSGGLIGNDCYTASIWY